MNLDDIFTGLAMFALAVAMAVAISLPRRPGAGAAVRLITAVVSLAWAGVGLDYLHSHFSANPPVNLQHTMLTITAVAPALLPVLLLPTAARSPTGRHAIPEPSPTSPGQCALERSRAASTTDPATTRTKPTISNTAAGATWCARRTGRHRGQSGSRS